MTTGFSRYRPNAGRLPERGVKSRGGCRTDPDAGPGLVRLRRVGQWRMTLSVPRTMTPRLPGEHTVSSVLAATRPAALPHAAVLESRTGTQDLRGRLMLSVWAARLRPE